MTIKKVDIGLVDPNPFQVRDKKSVALSRESISDLAKEMRERGVWGAIRARKVGSRYQICFGHRRLRALKHMREKTVTLDVVDLDDQEMKIDMAVENFQRRNLTNNEKLKAWKMLLDEFKDDPKPVQRTSKLLGISQETAAHYNTVANLYSNSPQVIELGVVTVSYAHRLGERAGKGLGPKMVRTAAKKKLNQPQLRNISAAISKQPKVLQDVLAELAVNGRISNADDVAKQRSVLDRKKIQEFKAKALKDMPPTDLVDVVRQWNQDLPEIIQKLEVVASQTEYADYIAERAPRVAMTFRENLERLTKACETISKGILPRLED